MEARSIAERVATLEEWAESHEKNCAWRWHTIFWGAGIGITVMLAVVAGTNLSIGKVTDAINDTRVGIAKMEEKQQVQLDTARAMDARLTAVINMVSQERQR